MPRGPNPFRPGFGVSPRVLAGRDDLIAEFETALDEVQAVDRDDLAAFASVYQHLIRDEREVAFAAAGLPVGVDPFRW